MSEMYDPNSFLMVNNVPKIIPWWHGIELQDVVRKKSYSKYSSVNVPDHGGVGIDVSLNAGVNCTNPKYANCQMQFAADKCALPFFPLKKVENLTEPCLTDLRKKRLNRDRFSLKLAVMRTHIKKAKENSNLCFSNLISLKKKLKTLNIKQKKEINVKVPKSLAQLADIMPKQVVIPAFNFAYAGGILALYSSLEQQSILHPDSETLSKLCKTPLIEGNDQCYIPDLSRSEVIDLKNDTILQVEAALDGYSCVRQMDSFHLVNTRTRNIFSKSTDQLKLHHIAPSPYNPMEILSIYGKGVMELTDMETQKILWSVPSDLYNIEVLPRHVWMCSYGSQPFSAFSLNEQMLYQFDFREKKLTARQIFSINNASCYVDEELIGLKQWNKNPFQYFLASNRHLIICDERYPKTPVMYWNHCLEDHPMYIECADFNADTSIIVIGTQETQQLASFVCSHQTEVQPVSLNPPMQLSAPIDCIKSLRLHCHYINDNISMRFSSPLTGVCVIPNKKDNGFTVLQSTSVGDIFYQDYKQSSDAIEKTYNVGLGCVLTPPEKILPHLSELLSDSNVVKKASDGGEVISRIRININEVLNPSKNISANCMLCRSSNVSEEKELVFSDPCPTCNLTSAESECFSKAAVNNSVIIGPTSEESSFLDCDLDYLSKFDDTYSKRILAVWLESDDNVEDTNVSDTQVSDVESTSNISR